MSTKSSTTLKYHFVSFNPKRRGLNSKSFQFNSMNRNTQFSVSKNKKKKIKKNRFVSNYFNAHFPAREMKTFSINEYFQNEINFESGEINL